MKHIVMSDTFAFSTTPFPAFRAELVYGRNKHDREFLPVKDVAPIIEYTVFAADQAKSVLYKGADKAAAESAKTAYDIEQKAKAGSSAYYAPTASVQATPATLPEGQFRIIKTRDKGTVMVVPGDDSTNRCLLFVGCEGGFRGGVSLVQGATTAQIIKECAAGNACESRTDVIALFEVGQTVVFSTYGRRTNEIYAHTWDGKEVKTVHYSAEEWKQRNAVATPPSDDDVEVL